MRRSDDPHAANLTPAAWEGIRGLLLLRCGSRCEASGQPLQPGRYAIHHRDSRGMGGTSRGDINALSNLLVLTDHAHTWTHANPLEAGRLGWILPTSRDVLAASSAAPVVLFSGRRVLLDPANPWYLPPPGPPYDLAPHPYPQ